jgi:hypothetical protein
VCDGRSENLNVEASATAWLVHPFVVDETEREHRFGRGLKGA